MCTPYEAFRFSQLMKNVGNQTCDRCLPDCASTLYDTTVSASPFRRCDNKNLGLSDLCTFEQDTVSLDPPIWGQNVMDEVRGGDGKKPLPSYIKDNVKSNTR